MEQFNSKVLLFGEYSILHNSMALVMPLEKFFGELTFGVVEKNDNIATTSNEYLKKFCDFIAQRVDNEFILEVKRFEKEIENGLFFKSNIPMGVGLGSSGALVAAIFLRYLRKAKEVKDGFKIITAEKTQQLKISLAQMESYFHGTSSGIDPLSSVLNCPILVEKSKDIVPVEIPEKDDKGKNVIFLLNTGIERHTSDLMVEFNRITSNEKFKSKGLKNMITYTNESIESFLTKDAPKLYESLGKLSQFQLDEMAQFIPESYHETVKSGIDNGDYFLKLCGAGGGGYMLGFTENWKATQEKLNTMELEKIYQF